MAVISEEDYLAHYGILRKSGRYPWGSGGTQSARNRRFLDEITRLRKEEGLSNSEIARGFGITTNELLAAKSIARNEQRQQQVNMAQRLKDKGYSNIAIGKRMDINESSVRSLLDAGTKDTQDVLHSVAGMLKEQVAKKTYLDVGAGTERHLGIASTKLSAALAVLKEEGYEVHTVKHPQLGTGENTTLRVLVKPGTTQKQVWENRDKIRIITDHSEDGGRSFLGLQTPINVSSRRLQVRYAEDGGGAADGVIFVRPGARNLSLGKVNYAQVRIAIDGTHYLKGMAVYKDDLPPGVDLQFNTNKSRSGSKLNALKKMERDKDGNIDKDNPFGSVVRQIHGENGKVISAMNKVNEEGDWGNWSKSLSAQMLSKQSPDLAKKQLAMLEERKRSQLEEIKALTNPNVRKLLLEKHADSADSAATGLKAYHLPRQASHVIMPVSTMKPNEIYAPKYVHGESVVLVRFPHGGTFEIPELTVNNRHAGAKKLLGNDPQDAVGIHHSVAERLSGADFDGDTVLVIPNNRGAIKTKQALEGLKDFDPVRAYPAYDGMPTVTKERKQQLMGDASNLITDMTIRGANSQELARAVRYSMVAIDAEKHQLDHKSASRDNGIPDLKAKYQGIPTGAAIPSRAGASTLISKAGSPQRINKRKPRPASEGGPIDKKTGKRVFVDTGESFINRDGEKVFKKQEIKKLAFTEDAHTLSSGTPIEKIYADHSNKLKAMANEARLEMVHTKAAKYEPSAKRVYHAEVASLDAKLSLAERNAPLERQAQVLAKAVVDAKRQANPNMEHDDVVKISFQALREARTRTGAQKNAIHLTDREWQAIQAGALAPSRLDKILKHADLDRVRELATPRTKLLMTSTKQARAKGMLAQGYTQQEVASALGVSLTTLKTSLGGDG